MAGIRNRLEGVVYTPPDLARRFFSDRAWIDLTVGDALRRTAQKFPSKTAVVSDERALTFSALDTLSDRLAAGLLDYGLSSGDRAIFQLGTTVETAVASLACFKAGIIPVCAVPQYRQIEIGHLADLSGAKGYFVQGDFGTFDLIGFACEMMQRHRSLTHLVVVRGRHDVAPTLETLIERHTAESARARLAEVPVGSEDVLSFQLSGGTTGTPKIIPRFHAEYLAHADFRAKGYGITDQSTFIWPLPLMHNAGQLYALMPTVLHGQTTVLMPKVDIPRMMELIEKHQVTNALSIGPVAPQIIAYKDLARHDLSSLRHFVTMDRADSLEAVIKVPCSNLFGITEGLLLGCPEGASAFARHRSNGFSGCPLDEVRLLEPESERPVPDGMPGELCFRGPSSLRGYFDAPEASQKALTSDGFFRSGDMMTAHTAEGRTVYRFEGRLRDNVNRGGEKIGCEEVESCASRHPAIADAKLVPMPDPVYGEKGCIFIIVRPGHQPPDIRSLASHLMGQGLAKFKCPERIEIVDEFPLTRVGKVDKPAMRRLIAEKLASERMDSAAAVRS